MSSHTLLGRLLWFAGIWAASVAALGAIALLLRAWIGG